MRLFADEDIDAMNAWYAARGLPGVARSSLPTTGFIEPGVAVGFLYRTDSDLAFVHHVVTNPAAPLRARFSAVRDIIRACEDVAARVGVRGLLTWTDVPSIARAARRAGGREIGNVTLLAKALPQA